MKPSSAIVLSCISTGLALVSASPASAQQEVPASAPLASELDNPKVGFNAKAALTWGGDELLKATYVGGSESDIKAGDGWFLSLGAEWHPLWFGDWLGLGVGLDAGLRHANLYVFSDGTASFERWALIPSLRSLLHFGGFWYGTAGAGVQFETGARLKGEGLLDELDFKFEPATGAMVEIGVRYLYCRRAGFDLTFRYTGLTYEADDLSIDASNLGLFLGAHVFL